MLEDDWSKETANGGGEAMAVASCSPVAGDDDIPLFAMDDSFTAELETDVSGVIRSS
ncbi:unnamed protein product, partial [Nesidiocoris tenuis]